MSSAGGSPDYGTDVAEGASCPDRLTTHAGGRMSRWGSWQLVTGAAGGATRGPDTAQDE